MKGVATTIGTTKGYVAYKLYVVSEIDSTLAIDGLAIKNNSTLNGWASGIAYTLNNATHTAIGAAGTVSYNILSYVRMAFVEDTSMLILEQDNVDPVLSIGRVSNVGNTRGFCPSYDPTGVSIIGMSYIYGAKYHLITFETPVPYATDVFTTTDGYLTYSDYSFEVEANVVKTIEVYAWVEGWDAECVNTILAQNISIDYSIKLL